jgi:hypothetical protein
MDKFRSNPVSGISRLKAILCLSIASALAACTPSAPTMGMEEAQSYCRAKISNPVDTNINLGVGVGSGGKVRTNAGLSVGVNLNALMSAEQSYEKCVMKNAGMAPIVPLVAPS